MESSGSNAPSPAPCNASGSSAPPPATHDVTIISDIATASRWLQNHAHTECKDRDHLVKFCEMLLKNPQKGDKEEWHRLLTTWKTGSVDRKLKNEKGQWRNRPLPDIRSDVKDAVIRRVAELAESYDTTAGVPPPRAHDPHSLPHAASPRKDPSTSGASSSAPEHKRGQGEERSTSDKRHGIKRIASVLTEQSADYAATKSKRISSEQGNADNAASSSKRKTIERGSSASSAIAPAQPPKKSKADKSATANNTTINAESWAELHELRSWLTTTDATRIRRDEIEADRKIVDDLLCYPPSRAGLKSAAERLRQPQRRQSLGAWHYSCVQQLLQCYRRWQRPGGFADWRRPGPQVDLPIAAVLSVETVGDMRQRQNWWWTTELTRSFRRFTTLRTTHPQLIASDEWKKLETRFVMTMRSAYTKAIRQVIANSKDFAQAVAVGRTIVPPKIANNNKQLTVPEPSLHYHFSSFLANQVQRMQIRSEEIDAMAEHKFIPQELSATPPDENDKVERTAERKSAPQAVGTTPSNNKIPKMSRKAFLERCRSTPDHLPYSAFLHDDEPPNTKTSNAIRQLALIHMKGCSYQQLPLIDSQLFAVAQGHITQTEAAMEAEYSGRTEAEYIEEAQQRLHECANDAADAYAGIRFLNMRRSDAEAVGASCYEKDRGRLADAPG